MIRILKSLALLLIVATAGLPALAQDAVFETPALNTGLGPVPDRIDRDTPRAAMASFLRAADDEDWSAAAHLLDLGELPPSRQAAEGPRLAHHLYDVIDRKAVLDWSALLNRPDALQIQGGDTEATAGDPRRSLLLRDLPLDVAPVEIRLNRLQPEGTDQPVWVFPVETVRHVPALHEMYGPSQFELALPEAMRTKTVGGLMRWEWIGLPVLIVAAVLLGWTVHRTLRLARRHAQGRIATGILAASSKPLIIASVTGLIWWVTSNVFVFSGRIDVFLAPAIATGFVTAALLFIVSSIEALLNGLVAPGEDVDLTLAKQAESRVLATRLNAARRVLVVVVFLIGAGVVLSSADLANNLGLSLLASAGAVTIVLGFAARNVLGNIMASLQIALNQSARVGDRVVYKGELCHVERINMTFVQLRNWDSTRLIVPVEEFASETFSNWTLQDPAMLRVLKLKLDPHADIDALRRVFDEVLDHVATLEIGQNLGDLDGSSVNVAEQDIFGIEVWFSIPCADPNSSWEVACAVREKLVARAAQMERDSGTPIFASAAAAGAA
ncbi:mechanosensitive ion channel [Paracoccus liaowanqingii]|uniref:Mechanosensitive ion channel n=1 Tax=Paracoccus liaowanqingii TaxID=2560053 RepID=A0A4Z1CQR8_9RHOB|nr:mechanosensitive ion channel domain-containing protein [Paracoccus liaowanqingii]TGN67435.1 mechanosensitive ion channel [Paracoccus liaowanqingii]